MLKRISLETMDGYEFQKFVANLFKKLGFKNVKVGPPTADGGIDISMEQRSHVGPVKFIVECKHHPERSIGRPVVQKLHSAVMHTPVLDKGIIATSGHFSNQAIKYAEEVGIELIDINKLKELARKVRLSLEVKPSLLIDNCFPISSRSKVIDELFSFLQSDLIGFSKDSANIKEVGLMLLPSYMVDYSMNATFSTSVGVIHSIDDRSTLFLSGDKGEPIKPIITDPLLSQRHKISELDEGDLKEVKLTRKAQFVMTHKEMKGIAVSVLRKLYTKTVSYYGANNVHYTKTCTPRKRNITLMDIKRVYLPIWNIAFSILKKEYAVLGTENPYKLNVLPSYMLKVPEAWGVTTYPDNCMICSRDMEKKKYVCNECGLITCDKDSFECKLCGKMVCREHTAFKRKFLILRDKYCHRCAKSEGIIS